MKARKYFLDISCVKNSYGSTQLSTTVFTKNLKTAKLVAEKIVKENLRNWDLIKICYVTCKDKNLKEYSHIEEAGTINNVGYGF